MFRPEISILGLQTHDRPEIRAGTIPKASANDLIAQRSRKETQRTRQA